jgi:hypothetical protein
MQMRSTQDGATTAPLGAQATSNKTSKWMQGEHQNSRARWTNGCFKNETTSAIRAKRSCMRFSLAPVPPKLTCGISCLRQVNETLHATLRVSIARATSKLHNATIGRGSQLEEQLSSRTRCRTRSTRIVIPKHNVLTGSRAGSIGQVSGKGQHVNELAPLVSVVHACYVSTSRRSRKVTQRQGHEN